MTRTFTAYSAVTSGELRQYLFGGNRFPAIGLCNRKKQFSLLLRGQGESAFVVFGQSGHGKTIGVRVS